MQQPMGIYSCVEECQGCAHVQDKGASCDTYYRPFAKWSKLGGCEGATHIKRAVAETPAKKRVGQQKQKKAS